MRDYIRRLGSGAIASLLLLCSVGLPSPVIADDLPDLIIEQIEWSPENPDIGDQIEFMVTVRNQGNAAAASSYVALYIDDVYQTCETVGELSSDAAVTVPFTWSAQAGPHNVKAVADHYGSVAQDSEVNNEEFFAFSVAAPDLVVDSVSWTPENPSIGDQVEFSITVKNRGNKVSRYSRVELLIEGASRGVKDVIQLAPGANTTVMFTWTAQVGSYLVEAVADPWGQVTESNEENNTVVDTCETAAPDLIIDDLTWLPEDPTENVTVTFSITVRNQGDGKSAPCYVYYYVNGNIEGSEYISSLSINGTAETTFLWVNEGNLSTFKAVVDKEDDVVETDETNNEKEVYMPAIAPDLVITNIAYTPSTPVISHRLTMAITIKNQGKTESCKSLLNVCIDGYDIYEWQYQIPAIPAGDTFTQSLEWTVQKESHEFEIIVDAQDNVFESDETNNTKTYTVGVINPVKPDLIIKKISWSPENPSTGDEVTFDVRIKNQGEGDARGTIVAYFCNDTMLSKKLTEEIEAGDTIIDSFTWTAAAGDSVFRAVADYNHSVAEADESNNELEEIITAGAPDLIVDGITWSPVEYSAGDLVTFTMIVENRGSVAAGNSRLAYYVNGFSRGYHDINEIDAGDAAMLKFTWTAQSGSNVIMAVADANDQVIESEEENNVREVKLPPSDLVITDISWSPEIPSENETVVYTATVANQGSGKADASDIYLYIDGLLEDSASIGEMAAGASVEGRLRWKAPAGSHTVQIFVDGDDRVTELDEFNNTEIVFIDIMPSGATDGNSEQDGDSGIEIAGIYLEELTTSVEPGEDFFFALRAANPSDQPTMNVDVVVQAPSGITVNTAEFEEGDKNRYHAAYTIEPGEVRLIEILLQASEAGNFNIMCDASYYYGEDPNMAQHQILTVPVTVGTAGGSGIWEFIDGLPGERAWWLIAAAFIVAAVTGLAIFGIRRRSAVA